MARPIQIRPKGTTDNFTLIDAANFPRLAQATPEELDAEGFDVRYFGGVILTRRDSRCPWQVGDQSQTLEEAAEKFGLGNARLHPYTAGNTREWVLSEFSNWHGWVVEQLQSGRASCTKSNLDPDPTRSSALSELTMPWLSKSCRSWQPNHSSAQQLIAKVRAVSFR
jgi:hypothetical protein